MTAAMAEGREQRRTRGSTGRPRVALVQDWLVAQRGGEQVLLELARLFPEAPVFTLVHAPGAVHPEIEARAIHTSFVQRLPGAPRRFRQYLPLFPAAVARFDLADFDLVISTSHCVAKGAVTRAPQKHISYVHTPMRYVWDQMPHYLAALPAPLRPLARTAAAALRRWDVASARRPDVLVANSQFVRARIARAWDRDADVIHPPVDVDFFSRAVARRRQGYLVVNALVPYKRVDLAIALARERRLPLTVIGDGPAALSLRRHAPPWVRFIAGLDREALRAAYTEAEALLFCAEEDFGIVPVEAMAAGCPVVAFAAGGTLETVVGEGDLATGVFFPEPSLASLSQAFDRFLARRAQGAFAPAVLRARARRFDRAMFLLQFQELLARSGFADIAGSRPETGS